MPGYGGGGYGEGGYGGDDGGSVIVFDIIVSNRIQITGGIAFNLGASGMLVKTPSKQIVTQGNSQTLVMSGVLDTIDNLFWDEEASISGTLVDDNGNTVPGCDQIIFQYTADSNGVFVAQFGDETFYPSVGTGYTLLIDGNDGSGIVMHRELVVEVQADTGG